MKHGTVKWFDSRPEKRFGFIVSNDGLEETFFHLNDGRPIKAGKLDPAFVDGERLQRVPQQGDRVVFKDTMAQKGPKAYVWGFEDEWHRAKQAIASRPIYRIVQNFRVVGTGEDTGPHVKWQGTDLRERGLETHYHPKYDRLPGGNDDIDWSTKWQISTDGGKTWQDCSCPSEYENQFDSRGRRYI